MVIQLEWQFWFCAFTIFVLIRLRPPIAATAWWGLLNAGALTLLLGVMGVGALGAFTLSLWILLRFSLRRKTPSQAVSVFAIAALAVGLLLLAEKILFEIALSGGLSAPFETSARILELIAFSYVALRAWDAISAVRDGEDLLDPLSLLAYLAPFFMMPAGPINAYRHHLRINSEDTFAPPTGPRLLENVELIVFGLFLKFVLAELLHLYVVGLSGNWPTGAYSDSLVTFLYIYLDFAGYSLLALGIGNLLGVPTPINFDRPLLATSLTDFWSRWHMSLGDWVKRNIYFPLQIFLMRRTPESVSYLVNTASLMAGFVFVGLWHRLTHSFLVWGILFGCLLSIEKVVRDKLVIPMLKRNPWLSLPARVIGPIYAVGTVVAMLHFTAISQMVGNAR